MCRVWTEGCLRLVLNSEVHCCHNGIDSLFSLVGLADPRLVFLSNPKIDTIRKNNIDKSCGLRPFLIFTTTKRIFGSGYLANRPVERGVQIREVQIIKKKKKKKKRLYCTAFCSHFSLFVYALPCRMFQVKASLPVEHQLKVQVMDWDLLSADDLVGETVIDLEDRLLTKNRATCGLPKSYCV